MPKSVLVAMSGGVDSSVCALVLKEAEYSVTGTTMKLFGDSLANISGGESTCCSLDDIEDAREVCRKLDIPYYVFNYCKLFATQVVDSFCDAYLEGKTPNPCLACNRHLKFDALNRRRAEMNIDYLATGHYARIGYDEALQRYTLLRGRDDAKDQSYLLYALTQDQLAHLLFPLGELTKAEVRELAAHHGFVNAEKPESQDICFIPNGDYPHFIERYQHSLRGRYESDPQSPNECDLHTLTPGDIVDTRGCVVGTHQGIARYTIGQRKGIGVAAAQPLYVLAKHADTNQLVVGTTDELLTQGIIVHDINLIARESIEGEIEAEVKTHYRQQPISAFASQPDADTLRIRYATPQTAAAPGQAAVLYLGESVLGGGTIAECF